MFGCNYALSTVLNVIQQCLNSGGFWLSGAAVAFGVVESMEVLIRT